MARTKEDQVYIKDIGLDILDATEIPAIQQDTPTRPRRKNPMRAMYEAITYGGGGDISTGRPGKWESPVQIAIPIIAAGLVAIAPFLTKSEVEAQSVAVPTFPEHSLVEADCPITGNEGPTTIFTCFGPTDSETDNTTVRATPLPTTGSIRSLEVSVNPPGDQPYRPTVIRGRDPLKFGPIILQIGNQGKGRLGVTEQLPAK